MVCMRFDPATNKNVTELVKLSTGETKTTGPFYDMHQKFRAISHHPIVSRASNLSNLKPGGTRNTKLLASDPLIRSTYISPDEKNLQFKGVRLQPEQIYQNESPDQSLNKENLSAKELSVIYRKYRKSYQTNLSERVCLSVHSSVQRF